jgi:hypothetical protein
VRRLLAPLVLLVTLAAACGSPSPHPATPTATPPSPSAVNALADLPQDLSLVPGDRNTWDLDPGFALQGGGYFDPFQRAMQLQVGLPATPPTADSLPGDLGPGVLPFPYNPLDGQRWSELQFTTPVVARGAGQLAALVASPNTLFGMEVVLAGSLGLPAAGGALVPTRLSQTVDLTGVAAPLTLGWRQHGLVRDGSIPGPAHSWQVVVRNAADGSVLTTAPPGNAVAAGPVTPFDVSAAENKTVTIDFELLGSPSSFVGVDEIQLLDGGAVNHLVNPGFEGAALGPWRVTGADQPCQVVSGKRIVGGLEIERRVFARPDLRWARFVDVFRNAGSATVTTQVNYLHELAAVTDAVIQERPSQKALSAWDGGLVSPARRDVAVVFGSTALAPVFRSVSAPGGGNGGANVWTRFPLTVPAGQTRVIVQFVVLTEIATGDTPSATATPTQANLEADAIVAGFWSTTTYREGMTADQVAAIVNF